MKTINKNEWMQLLLLRMRLQLKLIICGEHTALDIIKKRKCLLAHSVLPLVKRMVLITDAFRLCENNIFRSMNDENECAEKWFTAVCWLCRWGRESSLTILDKEKLLLQQSMPKIKQSAKSHKYLLYYVTMLPNAFGGLPLFRRNKCHELCLSDWYLVIDSTASVLIDYFLLVQCSVGAGSDSEAERKKNKKKLEYSRVPRHSVMAAECQFHQSTSPPLHYTHKFNINNEDGGDEWQVCFLNIVCWCVSVWCVHAYGSNECPMHITTDHFTIRWITTRATDISLI